MPDSPPPPCRLQRFLSMAGVTSRREAEELIRQGRVRVNGRPASIGQKVDPASDRVEVDGTAVRPVHQRTYVVLHKPRGYVSTRKDTHGRPTVLDLVGGDSRYLYPVGRLDSDSEGLVLLTDDGDLAHVLMHPRHEVFKTYRALVDRALTAANLARLQSGVKLDDGPTRPALVRPVRGPASGCWYEVSIAEGRNRQVRRMFRAVGASVRRLIRVALGPLRLGGLPVGACRSLTPRELRLLKEIYAHSRVSA
ncbi:MAG: rRNA pseudouridine synthase [Candidatus Riflebacteria bacterium]|nr:rRNA pseudouridine synthase [Candidatus Riflebacteria bacterium]